MRLIVCALVLSAAMLPPVQGQEEGEMSTDRPGYTDSTETVAPGTLQLESGILLSRHALSGGLQQEAGAPFSLLRIGLTRFAELRAGSDGFTRESRWIDGQVQQHGGTSDLQLSAKIRLHDDRVYLPAFALIAGVSVPTGAAYFSSGRLDPFLELAWSKSLPAGFDAGGIVSFGWGGDVTEHGYSLSVSHSLGEGLGVFGEIYRVSPVDGDEALHWIANGGITKMLTRNTQLDLEAGHTVQARTPYWFLGAGFAFRVHAGGAIGAVLSHFH